MAVENETADQVVRMVLQGSEVVLKLSGEAALKVATMIYNALKGDLTTKGRATLWEFMKSGKEQKMFKIPDTHLKAFTMASKKYGFPFVVLKDKTSKDGFTSILAYSTDASKVDRVMEKLQINAKKVKVTSEIKTDIGDLVNAFDVQMQVPFELIDGLPEPPKHNKRLLAELQKYAAKIKQNGPQVVEPVKLLGKTNGRDEIIPGEGAKRIMAFRLAGYTTAVADIMVPKKKEVEVQAENIDERPPQERNEAPRLHIVSDPPEETPTKEEKQTVNPTMARTSGDPASGQDLGARSKKDGSMISTTEPESRPSVRKKLEECKKISDERQSAKTLAKELEKISPPKKPDMR